MLENVVRGPVVDVVHVMRVAGEQMNFGIIVQNIDQGR